MTELQEIFGKPIHVYSRAQAIADGVVISLPQASVREAGFNLPIDMTASAHADCVQWGSAEEGRKRQATGQDEEGRLWDVLCMTRHALRLAGGGRMVPGDRHEVVLHRVPPTGAGVTPRRTTLTAVVGCDAFDYPIITLTLPDED